MPIIRWKSRAQVCSLRLLCGFLFVCVLAFTSLAQTLLNVDKPTAFNQDIILGPNKRLTPKSFPLPARKSLDFTVSGLAADAALDPKQAREARDYLVRRINAAYEVVNACMGNPHRSTGEIIRRLKQATAAASRDLARDLNNLLIATLVGVDIKGLNEPERTARF